MPTVQIYLPAGHSTDNKRLLVNNISEDLASAGNTKKSAVKIILSELPLEDFELAGQQIIVQIYLLKGRTLEQKQNIIQSISTTINELLDISMDNIKIILNHISLEDYAIGGKLLKDIRMSN